MPSEPISLDSAAIARDGLRCEWLEPDGLGGFASGTVNGMRTRRYHALLLAALTPPSNRIVLVNGFNAVLSLPGRDLFLSSQFYQPGVVSPERSTPPVQFSLQPWPTWTFTVAEGVRLRHELFVPHGQSAALLGWTLIGPVSGVATLRVRPFLSGRDFHGLQHRNSAARLETETTTTGWRWKPYGELPAVLARSNGGFHPQPFWYENFLYSAERERGLSDTEDLIAPGVLEWNLKKPARLILSAEQLAPEIDHSPETTDALWTRLADTESSRRLQFPSPLHRAADAYLVKRASGHTLIAGYPWFGDWGRDTFIALRGLCLATGRWAEARSILLEWSTAISRGMLPNRFPDRGETPEYNSVDASLWYIIVVDEFLRTAPSGAFSPQDRNRLESATLSILEGYHDGTRYQIHADTDGLLACGEPGWQLTWMDAKAGDRVVTPRIGKPVEVEALWLNALHIGGKINPRWNSVFENGLAAFRSQFWNAERGCLYDVIDCDHSPGTYDPALRPNQIFAVGGLPLVLLEAPQAASVVAQVQQHLLTPLGLRTLAPGEKEYHPRYEGDADKRDSAYHQGTVWPWLIGPFTEAWMRQQGNTPENRAAARQQFLAPLESHLRAAGLGHLSEITDAEPPFTPRGCPFQAWSLGEYLRADALLSAGR